MSITSLYRRNVGGLDRGIRLTAGVPLVVAGLLLAGGVRGELPGILIALVGLLSLLTGMTGRCPLYVPFGISTAGPGATTREEESPAIGFGRGIPVLPAVLAAAAVGIVAAAAATSWWALLALIPVAMMIGCVTMMATRRRWPGRASAACCGCRAENARPADGISSSR